MPDPCFVPWADVVLRNGTRVVVLLAYQGEVLAGVACAAVDRVPAASAIVRATSQIADVAAWAYLGERAAAEAPTGRDVVEVATWSARLTHALSERPDADVLRGGVAAAFGVPKGTLTAVPTGRGYALAVLAPVSGAVTVLDVVASVAVWGGPRRTPELVADMLVADARRRIQARLGDTERMLGALRAALPRDTPTAPSASPPAERA